MSKTLFKRTKLSLIIILCSIIFWIYMIPSLPDSIPMQVEDDGVVIWTTNKYIASLFTVLTMVLIYAIMLYKPKVKSMDIDRKDAYERVYSFIVNTVIFLVFIAIVVVVLNAMGHTLEPNRFVLLVGGFLFVVIGNYFQKIPFNSPIGIKAPWTVNNKTIWRKTHQAASTINLVIGFVLLLAGIFNPALSKYLLFIAISGFIVPFLYSIYLNKKLKY
ncbi:hypothetical protein ERX35_002815 [Macrococcus equipercicus]|uniref:SdpI family protein n=1 Tax=Macrococcus equipercicus TaxID=69967 RepID=A0ABQ6R9E6_9STAP|nr:SdpI family protein [Macrococcus equipercicus]KAA1039937.1 hypothetical protein ERX35_002815 [Macrococcus equipercicus]